MQHHPSQSFSHLLVILSGAKDLIDHRPTLTCMLPVIEEGFNLCCREVCADLRIVQDGFLESTACSMGFHGGFVDQCVRTLFAYSRSQFQHHSLGEYKASRCLQVGTHAVRVDQEVLHQCSQ